MTNNLIYYKCLDCLSTFTSEEHQIDRCSCNGNITKMGEVKGTHFGHEATTSVCDARCTDACGPLCDCPCGGLNHGTGKMVTTWVIDGKVTIKEVDSEALARAAEWRTIRDLISNLLEEQRKDYETTKDWNTYRLYNSNKYKYAKICESKQHKSRIDKANTLILCLQ